MGEEREQPPRWVVPDWSWQDDAVEASLRALRKRRDYKAGLVIPTGGGKTRIALQVALRWLAEDHDEESSVLWVTHRRRLHLQARRALHWLLREPGAVPDSAASLFSARIKFTMIGEVASVLGAQPGKVGLIIVDEAHHAAAPSYEAIVGFSLAPVLFLTATPNRADNLPLGIDDIAYTITYRELFGRGCVVEPRFDPPLVLDDLDWSTPSGVRDLADYLLDRSEGDFGKVLVAVSRRSRAEVLYDAVLDLLDGRGDHPLSADDVGFCHADRSSAGIDPALFLDEFAARPNGILIATAQFVGEGFDDPSIDAVVVTYPSESISHLMQVAGRALRAAPGKPVAHVVQVRESPLEYHFDQRWLYQDISDELRPALVDRTYASPADLAKQIQALLDLHNVPPATRRRILNELSHVDGTADVQVLLTGVPFFNEATDFDDRAEWGAILVGGSDRTRFVHIFNDVSSRDTDIKEHGLYLANHVEADHREGSLWKSYVDMITAMEYARRELARVPYAGEQNRPYQRGLSTTWLRYVTFSFAPVVPGLLRDFLSDSLNRDKVVADYAAVPARWHAAVKLELPLDGTYAFLLADDQATWLEENRRLVVKRLGEKRLLEGFEVLVSWHLGLEIPPIPTALVAELGQLVRPDRFATQYLRLK